MKRIDPFILGIAIVTIIALIGGTFLAFKATGKPLELYSASENERPQAEFNTKVQDLGQMKVSDVKSADFIIKNVGQKPLQVTNVSTSCNCTFAQLSINGKLSPRFSMHKNPSWTGEIEPGKEAKITVTYEPSLMPVKGTVERDVLFTTNDPQNQNISLKVTAVVD